MDKKDCQICGAEDLDIYIDGRTLRGPWANMCILCHAAVGVGLGTGKGQKYARRGTDFIKLEG